MQKETGHALNYKRRTLNFEGLWIAPYLEYRHNTSQTLAL